MATASWPSAVVTEEEEDDDISTYSEVCSVSELEHLGRKKVILNERVVVIFYVDGKVYALDHFCYRKPPRDSIA